MKKGFLLGIIVATLLLVTGCVDHSFQKVQVNPELTHEKWEAYFNVTPNPQAWTSIGDAWFFTHYPSDLGQLAPNMPYDAAMTAAQVRVPNFTKIKIEGPYTVQLYASSCNHVSVLGSNDQVRHTQIEIHGDTLYVHPDLKDKSPVNLQNTVIRIGIRYLEYLYHAGTGLVEGKGIRSHCLVVKSLSSGNVLLSGNMGLRTVVQGGSGTVSLLGVYSPTVEADVLGDGNVNLSGRIGINQIIKRGKGCLIILGADSNCLKVDANGGRTLVSGFVNLRTINTTGNAEVYLLWVKSDGVTINVHQNSHLGMAGCAQSLNIGVDGNARFDGKCMHAHSVYVKTAANGHANVSPERKLFADGTDYSSIYYYTEPYPISRFIHGKALIIPIFNEPCRLYPPIFVYAPPVSAVPGRACPTPRRRTCYIYPRRTHHPIEHRQTKTTKPTEPVTEKTVIKTTTRTTQDATYNGEKPYTETTTTTTTTEKSGQ